MVMKEVVYIRLGEDLKARAAQFAEREGRSLSNQIRIWVAAGVQEESK